MANPDPLIVVPDKLAATELDPATNGRMTIDLVKPTVTSYLFMRNAVQGEAGVPLKFALKDTNLPHKLNASDLAVIYAIDEDNKTKITTGVISNAAAGWVDFVIPGEFYETVGALNILMTIASTDGTNLKSIYLRQNVYPNEFTAVTINSEDYLNGIDTLVNTVKGKADTLQSEVDAINAALKAGDYVTTAQLTAALTSLKLATTTNDGLISASLYALLTVTTGKHYLQRNVLWSGVAKEVGTKITLSEAISNYNYIELTCNDNSSGVAQMMYSVTKTPIAINKQNIVDNDDYLTGYEIELQKNSDTEYEITHTHRMDIYPGNPAKVLLNTSDLLSINEIAGYI